MSPFQARAKRNLRRKVWKRSDKKCFYCGKELVFSGVKKSNKMTIEHLIPKSQGGTNALKNCVAACLECNHKRGNKKIKDFIEPPPPLKKEPPKCKCEQPRLVLNAKRECICIFCQGVRER